MCNNCHTKIGKARINHPYGEKYEDPWHGGTMHCTSCHGPHGTENKQFTLLPSNSSINGLCAKCHADKLGERYVVHLKVPPRNEPKEKTINTEVPGYKSDKSVTVNKPAKVYNQR